jgi:hypothetical protein
VSWPPACSCQQQPSLALAAHTRTPKSAAVLWISLPVHLFLAAATFTELAAHTLTVNQACRVIRCCTCVQFYQPEALEILDRAAAGDDSVCWRIDGVVRADISES